MVKQGLAGACLAWQSLRCQGIRAFSDGETKVAFLEGRVEKDQKTSSFLHGMTKVAFLEGLEKGEESWW